MLLALSGKSQFSSVGGSVGLCNVRGELSEGITNNYGGDINFSYTYLFLNSQWLLTADLSHSSARLSHNFDPDTAYENKFRQNYLGMGFRYCFNPLIKRRPREGQILPYFGFGIGLIQTSNNHIREDLVPEGYEISDKTLFQIGMQLEFGVQLRVTREWAVSSYFITRTAASDEWDGLVGLGDGKDWLIRGGVGLHYYF